MDEIIGISLITILSGGTLAALLVMLLFLLPGRVERTGQAITAKPGRAFLIGLVNLLFFSLIGAWFSGLGDGGGLIALLIFALLMLLCAIGLSSMVQLLRTRIYPNQPHGLKATVKTAVLLIIATLTPIVGWFGLAPILLIIGLGGGFLTLRRPKPVQTFRE